MGIYQIGRPGLGTLIDSIDQVLLLQYGDIIMPFNQHGNQANATFGTYNDVAGNQISYNNWLNQINNYTNDGAIDHRLEFLFAHL